MKALKRLAQEAAKQHHLIVLCRKSAEGHDYHFLKKTDLGQLGDKDIVNEYECRKCGTHKFEA